MSERGIHAVQIAGSPIAVESANCAPLYIGMAPVWQLPSENWKDVLGQAFMINDVDDAREKIGYYQPESGMWQKEYSLCEPVYVHFGDEQHMSAPIMVLVGKCDINESESEQSATVTISGGIGYLDVKGLGILSSVSIADKESGKDFSASYDEYGRWIVIRDLKGTLGKSVTVKYKTVTGLADIALSEATFDVVDLIEQKVGEIPTTLLCPGWENEHIGGLDANKTVAQRLMDINKGQIDNHWYTTSIFQLHSETRSNVETDVLSYNYPEAKVCWPYYLTVGLVLHLAVIYAYEKLIVDLSHTDARGIPYESESNEEIYLKGCLCDAAGAIIEQTDKQADVLNDIGVATAKFVKGGWRTAGVVMSNYYADNVANIAADELNDVAVRMKDYVCNDFQTTYMDEVDKPIPPRRVKEIRDDYGIALSGLVSMGALLFAEITYNASDNTAAGNANGEFVFAIKETNTPPGSLIKAKVSYTPDGLATYAEVSS